MIGWVRSRIVELVIAPQATTDETIDVGPLYAPVSLRADLDPPDAAGESVQGLTVLASTSRPISRAIGGHGDGSGVSLEVRHELTIGLGVTHGDLEVAAAIRDAITLALVLRLLDSERELRATDDPATGQAVTDVSWSVDYRPLGDTPTEWARLTVTVDVELDR